MPTKSMICTYHNSTRLGPDKVRMVAPGIKPPSLNKVTAIVERPDLEVNDDVAGAAIISLARSDFNDLCAKLADPTKAIDVQLEVEGTKVTNRLVGSHDVGAPAIAVQLQILQQHVSAIQGLVETLPAILHEVHALRESLAHRDRPNELRNTGARKKLG